MPKCENFVYKKVFLQEFCMKNVHKNVANNKIVIKVMFTRNLAYKKIVTKIFADIS